MDVYRTEEEQVEALKRWFRDNGRSLIAAILLALVLVFGYRYWQDSRLHKSEAAAAQYESLKAAVRSWDTDAKPESLITAKTLAETLKKDFSASTYAHFAALVKARLAVKENDLAGAEAELRWVLDHKPAADLAALTQVRLARVLHAKGDDAGALAIVDAAKPNSYSFMYEKVRGDILLGKGDTAGARAAYEKARELEKQLDKPVNDALLDIKLGDLQGAAAMPGTAQPNSPADSVPVDNAAAPASK
ncbi:MAG: tetratricopeptide repeat protein [Spongiibacteraceae bacterium]